MTSKKVLIIALLCAALGAVCLTPLWAQRRPPLPDLGTAPDFHFTDSSKMPFAKENLRGKVWVADFIFTTCGGPCPVMSEKMAGLQKQFQGRNDVHYVSFSVNPDYDTPEILAEYGKTYSADFRRWHFLNGPQQSIHKLSVEGFKVGSLDDPINHSTRFILVDRTGQIRGYYLSTDDDEMRQLPRDIEALCRD